MTNTTTTTKRVIVAGAGPAGVLTAIHLLRRANAANVKYQVTLIDAGKDYGKLTPNELSSHRSWMIGLSNHGLTAIRQVPGLFEDYVKEIGIDLDSFTVCLGAKQIKQTADPKDDAGENLIVDRNYVVASLARYLNEHHLNDDNFTSMYHTKILYVDGANKRVLVRNSDNKETYVDYDILLGCDGVRSVVRGAFVQHNRDFECKISDIFTKFKAVHVSRPKQVDPASLSLLPSIMPNMNGICLPEKGDMVNITIGYNLNTVCEDELKSDDPDVVAAYLEKHIQPFELLEYDDFANQWVNQSWNTTGQVHCNYYHSQKLNAIIMGDAAHATSPSIGMGMNTALGDASALNRLLDMYNDNWDEVLPAFSKERVKEGRALTDLAFYLFSLSPTQQFKNIVVGLLRSSLSKVLPIWNDPQYYVGQGEKLSVVYDRATKMGLLPSVRKTNEAIMRAHFEKEAGMVTETRNSTSWMVVVTLVAIASMVLGVFFLRSTTGGGVEELI